MADAREKAVVKELADLYSRTRYIIDYLTSLRAPLGRGDSIEIPDNDPITVNADGDTSAAPEAVTTNVITLNANLHPWVNLRIPQVDSVQLLAGSWPAQTARQATIQLKNDMDSDLAEYLLTVAASTAYHDNVAGDSLTEDDILNSKAAMLDQDGVQVEDLALFVSPYGEASIMSISGFVPNFSQAEQGNLGIPKLGTVFGLPVYASNSVPHSRAVASTAFAIVSNVLTVTVAAGHGIVPGMLCTFDTVTAGGDMPTPTAVTSVTATTVVFAHTASNAAATEAGALTVRSSENLLLDLSHCFVAQQMMPKTRIVPDFNTTREAIQISTIWGRLARAGRVRVLHSPAASA